MPRDQNMVLPDPWTPLAQNLEMRAIAGFTSINSGVIAASGNDAFLMPFTLPCDATVYSLTVVGTNTTGNYDLALYNNSLARLTSKGSTAMANAALTHSFSDLRLRAGDLYFAAMSVSNASATVMRVQFATSAMGRGLNFAFATSSHPLPDPFVAAAPTFAVVPAFALGVR